MATNRKITPGALRQLLMYDSGSGSLIWRARRLSDFPNQQKLAQWNGRFSGRAALTCKAGDGYLKGRIFDVQYVAHRVAWAIYYGVWPDHQIDHINGRRDDNRIENLRDVTGQINSQNHTLSARNKSGTIGVCWVAARSKWRAVIRVLGRNIFIGYFNTKEEAVHARSNANKIHGFHPNHGKSANHPESAPIHEP